MGSSSEQALKPIWTSLQILGLKAPAKLRLIYYVYALIVNVLVTLCYPLSMLIQVFYLDAFETRLSNFSLILANVICSLKILNVFIKRSKLLQISKYIEILDGRVCGGDEKALLEHKYRLAILVFFGYCLICVPSVIAVPLPTLFANQRRLVYPAWFPWNWQNSTAGFHSVIFYQVFGLYYQIFQDVVCDTYPGILFLILRGHLGALGLRIRKIGYDPKKSAESNYKKLVQCIKDHKVCLRCYHVSQDITSLIMFIHFIFTQCIVCMTAINIIFVTKEFLELVFLFVYLIDMVGEIAISCYFGSELSRESEEFTEALYSCNWMDQDLKFRKTLIIFMQHTQKPWTVWAGGLISISLTTCMSVLKSAFSLFAVCRQIYE